MQFKEISEIFLCHNLSLFIRIQMTQDEIVVTLKEIIKDEVKCQTLENLLQIIQDNSLQTNLNDLSELQKKES